MLLLESPAGRGAHAQILLPHPGRAVDRHSSPGHPALLLPWTSSFVLVRCKGMLFECFSVPGGRAKGCGQREGWCSTSDASQGCSSVWGRCSRRGEPHFSSTAYRYQDFQTQGASGYQYFSIYSVYKCKNCRQLVPQAWGCPGCVASSCFTKSSMACGCSRLML